MSGVSFVVNFRLLIFCVVGSESEVNSAVGSVIAFESFVCFLDGLRLVVSSANVKFGQFCLD